MNKFIFIIQYLWCPTLISKFVSPTETNSLYNGFIVTVSQNKIQYFVSYIRTFINLRKLNIYQVRQ